MAALQIIDVVQSRVGIIPFFTSILLAIGFFKLLRVGRRGKNLPPGPPTLPIIGNMHQIPVTGLYKKFREWGAQYGSVFSLKIGPGTMIVLYDRKAVHDLLDKRGALYSERPIDYVANIVTGGDSFAFMNNTPLWRSERKIAAHNLSPRMLDDKIQPIQEAEASQLLRDLLETPADFYHHMQRTTASVANIVVWGNRGSTFDNFWGSCVYKAMDKYSEALEPGANPPVDQFPFLKLLPDRFAPWVRRARQSYQAMDSTWAEARRRVDARRKEGDKRISIVDRILDGEKAMDVKLTDHQLNHFLGVLVEGGAETTAASMLTSILMLAQNRDVQKKAQADIDRVCGSDRSPVWSDFAALPYINCIVKEGMRWHSVLPLGVPHRVNQDDWYDGMLIPKDSTVVIPIWAMHFEEKLGYDSPAKYYPERFADMPRLASDYAGSPDFMHRDHYGYGAGRRICPGMHLAERTQWRITAKLLWAFDILPDVDQSGKEIPLDSDAYHEGIAHCPEPFKVRFVPRNAKHSKTIREEALAAQEFLKVYD